MLSTVQYWFDRVVSISTKLEEMECPNQYEKGVKCILVHLKRDTELQHHRAVDSFSKLIHIPGDIILGHCIHSTSSSSADSDTETESEDSDSDMND